MTSKSPADVAQLAERVYFEHAPLMGCHSPCREFASIAAGICAALDLDCTLEFDKHYTEDGVTTQHYWIRFSSGERLDLWGLGRRVRLIEGEPAGEGVVAINV